MSKTGKVTILGCLGLVGLAGLGAGLVGVVLSTRPCVVCVSGTNASLTARGPMAFFLCREWRKQPDRVDCGSTEPAHLPVICTRRVQMTDITVHDRGALGITIVGDQLCRELDEATEPPAPQEAP